MWPKSSNHVADCLLHVLVCPVHPGVNFSTVAAIHPSEPDVLALSSMHIGLKLDDAVIQEDSHPLLCDVCTCCPHPVVPVAIESLTQFTPSSSLEFGHQ